MSQHLVVDASVAVRWVVGGSGSVEARSVLYEHSKRVVTLHAPALQRAEVANALWKYERSSLLTRDQTESALDRYLKASVRFHSEAWLDRVALVLASAHNRSAYDCLYLALSIELGCELLTADRRFFNAVGTAFPSMRLLKSEEV